MKKFTFILALLFTAICFSQNNRSDGPVFSSISGATSGEIFRFKPGLVTQLDSGTGFNFNSSRWFSMGKLATPGQTVFGLRFQMPNRALTIGYQDINDTNPRIQWIGAGSSSGTDLEFRTANSFTSTTSTLVASMTNDGKTYFGNPLSSNEPLVGIDYSNMSSSTRTGLIVENTSTSGSYFTGAKLINNVSGYIKTGLDVQSAGSSYLATGINVNMSGTYQNTGARVRISGTSNGSSYGFAGYLPNTGTGFGAAIYGSSAAASNRYAGYFNGNVVVTGTFTASDKKLKENIQAEENVLEKLAQLNAVTYTFKENDQLNLSSELQHGFIAQNIEEVFPELITKVNKPIFDKEDKLIGDYEYKAVNYTGLISVLTSSIQELNEKVASLESEIENMNNGDRSKKNTTNDIEEVGFSMEQNRPNPFTDKTVINYTLPNNTKASISVFDLSGKFIRDYNLADQKGQVIINSSEIGKGMFVYALTSNNEVMISKKMIIK